MGKRKRKLKRKIINKLFTLTREHSLSCCIFTCNLAFFSATWNSILMLCGFVVAFGCMTWKVEVEAGIRGGTLAGLYTTVRDVVVEAVKTPDSTRIISSYLVAIKCY